MIETNEGLKNSELVIEHFELVFQRFKLVSAFELGFIWND
jgi:hypothetical protein